ncbi:MAG: hypothetical protein JO154_25135 [Chitinophaga sp.]|uniref:hypothetical protein n=1 Tax=Chitinophaga sp. TaxID=1869181 RepID=UPI0025B89A17|nr:hypothetical protein [Chitinophaga sp.]MBV8255904.1 hypothetical protein [Chitinophaga sp.]
MDWDEILDPFSPDFQDAMEEHLRIVNMQDGLVAAANELIARHYPASRELSPEDSKQLQRVIISQSVQMANAIHEAMNNGTEEE